MLKHVCLVIAGLLVALFVGSVFVWAIGALLIAVAFAVAQHWGFVALFGLASVCWFGCGVFFVRLPCQQPNTDESAPEGRPDEITPFHRRVAAVFGVIMGTAFGLATGTIYMIFALVFSGSVFVPVAIMFGIICVCALSCYALPDVGPEVLSQLEVVVDVM